MKQNIENEKELKDFINGNHRAVVVFGKPDCLHCSIVETVLESIKKDYPLVAFGYTLNTDMAHSRGLNEYPYTYFYENGIEQFRLRGSGEIFMKVKDFLNLWIRKE